MKDKGIAYLCWCAAFFGVCGIQRLYIGKTGTGLLWLFTFGLLGFGQLIDAFTLGGQVERYNLKHAGLLGSNQPINVNIQNQIAQAPPISRPVNKQVDFEDLRSNIKKLDKLYVADLIDDAEYNRRKKTLLRILAESIYDSDPEDGLLASSKLLEEGLLSEQEFKQLKTAVL